MKLAYFHLKTADNDDVALGEAKVLGHVPPTCLLGGAQVWKAIRAGLDPCATCNGPRARCGGRYTVEEVRMKGVFGPNGKGEFEAALRAFGDALEKPTDVYLKYDNAPVTDFTADSIRTDIRDLEQRAVAERTRRYNPTLAVLYAYLSNALTKLN